MRNNVIEWLGFLLILLLAFSVFVGVYAITDSLMCNAKTADIGFPHSWGLVSGCLIETEPGIWIPLENWRNFD